MFYEVFGLNSWELITMCHTPSPSPSPSGTPGAKPEKQVKWVSGKRDVWGNKQLWRRPVQCRIHTAGLNADGQEVIMMRLRGVSCVMVCPVGRVRGPTWPG